LNAVQEKSERRSQKLATRDRHRDLAARLVEAAEVAIEQRGLGELRARDLARATGCSVGAIYGVFPTLDALVMAVNDRTLSALERAMEAERWSSAPDAQLAGFASAYLAFAARHRSRWAAVFQHRLPAGQVIAPDYAARQASIFARVAAPIAQLSPGLSEPELRLVARTLFSAVHGVVQLGLEEKLGTLALPVLDQQLRTLVAALASGLRRPTG